MGLLLIWRHTANIRKLLEGTESKLGAEDAGRRAPLTPANRRRPATRTTAIERVIARERNHELTVCADSMSAIACRR
jgi:hypothetical protein